MRERDLGGEEMIQQDEPKTLSPIALPIVIGPQSLHPLFGSRLPVETRRWRHALGAAAAGFHVSMPLALDGSARTTVICLLVLDYTL